MSEQLEVLQAPRKSKLWIFPVLSAVCVVIAALFWSIASFWNGAPFNQMFSPLMVRLSLEQLITTTQWFFLGLFLPVSLLLCLTSTKKKQYATIFLVISLLTLGIQLLCAILCLILNFLPHNTVLELINISVRSVPGSKILSSLLFILRPVLFDGSFSPYALVSALCNLLVCLGELLIILSNILCVIGFALLSLLSKKAGNP